MDQQEVVAVVGVANNGVIGNSGAIPWKSSVDMRHFKAITMGHPVVMGRKTFESIGRPLPGRLNVVLTRDRSLRIPGVLVLHSKAQVFKNLKAIRQVMIIGGDQIYREFYDRLTRIELTHLNVEADGDAFFHLDPSRDWKMASTRTEYDEKLGAALEFKTFVPDETKNRYLNAGVKGLLRMFGSGKPIPGSGAAAALQALLAAYLILTVIEITSRKEISGATRRTLAQYAFRTSSSIVPRLRALFLRDIEVFEEVIELRLSRDRAQGSERGQITRRVNRKTNDATAIPDEVYGFAAELLEMAEFLFWNGYKAVRGDSGAAISSSVSAMLSCVFIMSLNAKSLERGGASPVWATKIHQRTQHSLRVLGQLPRYLAADQERDPSQATFDF